MVLASDFSLPFLMPKNSIAFWYFSSGRVKSSHTWPTSSFWAELEKGVNGTVTTSEPEKRISLLSWQLPTFFGLWFRTEEFSYFAPKLPRSVSASLKDDFFVLCYFPWFSLSNSRENFWDSDCSANFLHVLIAFCFSL